MLASLVRVHPYALLAAACAVAFILLAVMVGAGLTDAFDAAIIEAIRAPELDAVLAPLATITELGSTWAIVVVAAIAFALGVAIGPWRHGLLAALTILLASIVVSLVKVRIARDRPELLEPIIVEHGFSFPSGHATLSMVAYGVLAVLVGRTRLPRWLRSVVIFGLGILVGLIGISRVWLGVHYPSDVLAGWALGGVVVIGYAALSRRVSPAPAAVAVDADPAAPRSDRPVVG